MPNLTNQTQEILITIGQHHNTQLLQWTPPPSSRPPPPQGPPSPTRRGQGPNQQYVATPGRSFNRQNSPERQQSSNQNIFPRGQGPQRDGRI